MVSEVPFSAGGANADAVDVVPRDKQRVSIPAVWLIIVLYPISSVQCLFASIPRESELDASTCIECSLQWLK